MGKLVVDCSLTLDGVMPAPSDEYRREGFEHGGWALAYNDAVIAERMAQGMSRADRPQQGAKSQLTHITILELRLSPRSGKFSLRK